MTEPVAVQMPPRHKTLDDYGEIVGTEYINDLRTLAKPLQGITMQHINSTRVGGGVAEILAWLMPLLQDLGIDAVWDVMQGPSDFYRVTKSFHNALQGHAEELVTRDDLNLYTQVNREAAENQIKPTGEVIIVHDPQPAALPQFWPPHKGRMIWRCHIDASAPNALVWDFLKQHLYRYDATIFSAAKFSQKISVPQFLIAPSIDPLAPKNRDLTDKEVLSVLERFHIDPDRPLVVQISRFDRFKDPHGVIAAYRMVKKRIDCQLVLAGGGATDDPEGAQVLDEVREIAGNDPDCKILDLPPFSDVEVNALQRAADVVLQKSLKEGFGLTVSEALWKGRPVVAGAAGGIPLQILDGVNGYLVHTVEGAAFRLRHLLGHPQKARRMGAIGKEFVRSNFLLTRHIRDYLMLMHLTASKAKSIDL